MGFLIDNPDPSIKVRMAVEQDPKKVFRAVLYDRDAWDAGSLNDTRIWRCDHLHSKEKANVVSRQHAPAVWEYSALNCGRAARNEWGYATTQNPPDLSVVRGRHGLIDDLRNDLNRDDMKDVEVDGVTYRGHLTFCGDGYRYIEVWCQDHAGRDDIDFGTVCVELRKNDAHHPDDIPTERLLLWRTAAATLLRDLRGVVFQQPDEKPEVRSDHEAANSITPKKHHLDPPPSPYIAVVSDRGQRWFNVMDSHGGLVTTMRHRGRAVRELNNQIRREAQDA